MLCDTMPGTIMPCHAMPCHAVLCCAMPYHTMLCFTMLLYTMPTCCAMLCHTKPCNIMLCNAMLCHYILFHSRTDLLFSNAYISAAEIGIAFMSFDRVLYRWYRVCLCNVHVPLVLVVRVCINGHANGWRRVLMSKNGKVHSEKFFLRSFSYNRPNNNSGSPPIVWRTFAAWNTNVVHLFVFDGRILLES